MEVTVLSVKSLITKDGNKLNQVFCMLNDGGVGNFFTGKDIDVGEVITLTIGIDRNCKFVVRPVTQ